MVSATIPDTAASLRRLLLALLAAGLASVAVDLLLLAHYESAWMLVPFAAVAVGLASVAAHAFRPTAGTVRLLRGAMSALFLTGLLGFVMHYRAGLEFQIDMDPEMPRWDLFWKVMRMKAPPPLAPGALLQLSLVGLVATYRDPRAARRPSIGPAGEQP